MKIEAVHQRLARLPDTAIAEARRGDNGLWYATVALSRRWVSDADFSTCRQTIAEAIQDCAAAVRADLRGDGKYASHWDPYDVEYRLLPHWEQRFEEMTRAMRKLLFVGECRSITAQRKGWTWKDGRLAAKPLFEALHAMGVDPAAHEYANLWTDNVNGTTYGDRKPGILGSTIKRIMARGSEGYVIVALGKRVSHELSRRGIVHVALVHPAARGAIRKRERYHAHVAKTLGPKLGARARGAT